MKQTLPALASAAALVFTTACLQAQTDLGSRYFEVGPQVIAPSLSYVDNGLGVLLKWNQPIAKNLDLHIRGAHIAYDYFDNDITEWSARVGTTAYLSSSPVRPYLGAELGLVQARLDRNGDKLREESLLLAAQGGIEVLFGEKFSMAFTARYDYYEKVEDGDFWGGIQANIKFIDTFSLVVGAERSDGQDTGFSLQARFRY